MGIFRTLLALSVVFAHISLGDKFLVGGKNAVQLFYMVSGFLIAYVLNNSYANKKMFYFNRALRIFPIYWVVALCFAVYHFAANTGYFDIFGKLPASANLLLILSNVFLFGQDVVMFLGIKGGEITPVKYFLDSDVPLYQGLLISPAWTLGVELVFYVIAPFVIKSPAKIILIFLASLCLRVYLISIGLNSDPWDYRFFPTEAALFMAGALAYHYGLRLWKERYAKYAMVLAIAVLVVYPLIPLDEVYRSLFVIITGWVLLPGLFVFQSKNSWDKSIGELSYPIYICHIPVIYVLSFSFKISNPLVILFVVALVSYGLSQFIDKNIESVRTKLRILGQASYSK